jgi:hypothetical protein
MKIIFVNFALNWVYRLYIDYIEGLMYFISKNIKNIEIKSVLYQIDQKYNLEDELKNIENENDKIILAGDVGFISNILQNFTKKIYFLNIEQLSHEDYYKYFRNLHINLEIIDYSEENIPFHKNIYKNSFLLSPIFKYDFKKIKNIDVLSIDNNNYRKSILNKINLHNKYNIEFINNTYGKERDELYNRTKVYVNIHCSEKHTTMELIRIINLLYNNVIVITQKSIFDKLLFVRNNLIICNNDEELEKYVIDVLDNYKYYYNLFFNNESGYDKRLYFDKTYYEKYVLKNIECLLLDK